MTTQEKNIALYVHIPFCSKLCHYCDFVKTANWNTDITKTYFQKLEQECLTWINDFIIPKHLKISSVYFGGGTPSLFTNEYHKILDLITPFIDTDTEINMEANPENISHKNLSIWKELGINRLSIGIQSFSEDGLKFLTRKRNLPLLEKIKLSQGIFENVNIDLIYGWNNQSLKNWQTDLETILDIKPNHLSLYLLTYAEKTPIGRAYFRKKIKAQNDSLLEQKYELACSFLKSHSYEHVEVSNWAKKNKFSRHNNAYWHDKYYIAIGVGSHGYIPSSEITHGIRYISPKNERLFIKDPKINLDSLKLEDLMKQNPKYLFEIRNKEQWLMEYVGTALRTNEGIDLDYIFQKSQFKFQASDFLSNCIENKDILLKNNVLSLTEKEWFREASWCSEVISCFY